MSDKISVELLPSGATLHGYDRWSVQYDRDANPMVAATEWSLDQRPFAVAGQRVVEIGCGTGRHATPILAGGAHSYTGVDGSPGMLEVARLRVSDPRCAWVQATLEELAGAPALPAAIAAPFDAALIVLVLEHVADLALPFTAAARLLRPGGVLRIVEIHPGLVDGGTVAHFQADGTEVRFTSFAHPIDELGSALRTAGFAIDSLDEHVAAGGLLARVPRLTKHRDRPVVLDVAAHRHA